MAKIDSIDRPTDAAFLLFHFAEEIEGITKVQKLLFLIENETKFGKKYKDKVSYEFEAYKMGPFSDEVYQQVELLLNMDAIEMISRKTSASEEYELKSHPLYSDSGSEGLSNKKFRITPKGHKIGKALADILDEDVRNELQETIEFFNSMPLRQLLEYVYENYEDMTEKSEIKEEVLG